LLSFIIILYFLFFFSSYGEVRSPGYLHIYKDRAAADAHPVRLSGEPSRSSDPTAKVIDLRSVNRFYVPDRQNKENLNLELELSEETVKLK
jgi:hypothetical protein